MTLVMIKTHFSRLHNVFMKMPLPAAYATAKPTPPSPPPAWVRLVYGNKFTWWKMIAVLFSSEAECQKARHVFAFSLIQANPWC